MATKKPATAKKPTAKKDAGETVTTIIKIGDVVELSDGRTGTIDAFNDDQEALVKVSPKLREWVSIEQLKAM